MIYAIKTKERRRRNAKLTMLHDSATYNVIIFSFSKNLKEIELHCAG